MKKVPILFISSSNYHRFSSWCTKVTLKGLRNAGSKISAAATATAATSHTRNASARKGLEIRLSSSSDSEEDLCTFPKRTSPKPNPSPASRAPLRPAANHAADALDERKRSSSLRPSTPFAAEADRGVEESAKYAPGENAAPRPSHSSTSRQLPPELGNDSSHLSRDKSLTSRTDAQSKLSHTAEASDRSEAARLPREEAKFEAAAPKGPGPLARAHTRPLPHDPQGDPASAALRHTNNADSTSTTATTATTTYNNNSDDDNGGFHSRVVYNSSYDGKHTSARPQPPAATTSTSSGNATTITRTTYKNNSNATTNSTYGSGTTAKTTTSTSATPVSNPRGIII
jgi:hypothetical protein